MEKFNVLVNRILSHIFSNFAGDTPLHHAVHEGAVEAVEFLLNHGANALIKGAHGYLPLHIAAEKKFTPCQEGCVCLTK
jgi:ankyrin repeat protein